MSDSVRPHRWQPTRLRRPWDSPGKNTGVGCLFLLQCMKVKSLSKCPTLRDPMDCSLPGSSVHGIFLARALEWMPLPSWLALILMPMASPLRTQFGKDIWRGSAPPGGPSWKSFQDDQAGDWSRSGWTEGWGWHGFPHKLFKLHRLDKESDFLIG